uniref:Uncharacterized protein n=1 Tax=Vitis vinifera TaxID=29760 RepID=F6GVS2_VITVI
MSVLSENHPYQIKQFIKISKNTNPSQPPFPSQISQNLIFSLVNIYNVYFSQTPHFVKPRNSSSGFSRFSCKNGDDGVGEVAGESKIKVEVSENEEALR